ncbi:MAG: hypothetical protein ACRD6W_00575 [Nitrososphaerales archaeon]
MVAMGCYLVVPLLIPVLTTHGLPLFYMGEHSRWRTDPRIRRLRGEPLSCGAGGSYAQLGVSRAMTFGALIEPTVFFVVFTVAPITVTDLPYVLAATVRSSTNEVVRPSHVLAAVAFFLVVSADTGRNSIT